MVTRQVMTFLLENIVIWGNTTRAPTSPTVSVVAKVTDLKLASKGQ